MRRTPVLAFLLLLMVSASHAQTPHGSAAADSTWRDAYRVYTGDGQPASLDAIAAAMDSADVVFVGEQHDDPVAHALQLALLQRAYASYGTGEQSRPVVLSLEMFERDVQPIVDEYLAGLITEQHFLGSARPWHNYETDYRPLVEFARAHELPVVAANAPRRYVNRVTRLGADALADLPQAATAWLPPLPYPPASAAYAARWNQMMADMMASHGAAEQDSTEASGTAREDAAASAASSQDTAAADTAAADTAAADTASAGTSSAASSSGMHGMGHMLESQALWDASMADAVARTLRTHPNALVLHMVGGFHVEKGLGTPAQLDGYRPGTRSLIVVVRSTEDVESFDDEAMAGLGDFVILTDAALPRSYTSSF